MEFYCGDTGNKCISKQFNIKHFEALYIQYLTFYIDSTNVVSRDLPPFLVPLNLEFNRI